MLMFWIIYGIEWVLFKEAAIKFIFMFKNIFMFLSYFDYF